MGLVLGFGLVLGLGDGFDRWDGEQMGFRFGEATLEGFPHLLCYDMCGVFIYAYCISMAYRRSRRASRKAGRRMSRRAGRVSRKVRRSRRVKRGGCTSNGCLNRIREWELRSSPIDN